jgi:tetratricopeptide (TPR) repeat protein
MHGSLPAASQPDPAGLLKAARAARRAGGAADLFATYLAARPEDAAARVEHGWDCWGGGQRDEATTAWQTAAALDPQAVPPRMALLHAARTAGDSARALALVDAVLADHPGLVRAWVERAILLREGGDSAQAEAAARQALHHAPDDPRALVEQARALRRRGAGRGDGGARRPRAGAPQRAQRRDLCLAQPRHRGGARGVRHVPGCR